MKKANEIAKKSTRKFEKKEKPKREREKSTRRRSFVCTRERTGRRRRGDCCNARNHTDGSRRNLEKGLEEEEEAEEEEEEKDCGRRVRGRNYRGLCFAYGAPTDPRRVANASDHYSDGEPMERIPTPPSDLTPRRRHANTRVQRTRRTCIFFFLFLFLSESLLLALALRFRPRCITSSSIS